MSVAASGTRPRTLSRRVEALRSVDTLPIVVAGLTVAVFLLRLSQLHQSLYGDEVWTYQDLIGHNLSSVVQTVHTGAENSPPLFFVLAWLSAKLGDPSVWIRLPSLVLSTATIPLIYLIGRETVGRQAGLIGAAIIAVSPFSIYYGIEARPYATMAFFVALATLAVLKAVKSGSRGWWIAYALAVDGAAYSHYTSVFVLAVLAIWGLWARRDQWRQPVLANALAALLYLPWLSHVRGKSLGVIGLLEPLNLHNVLTDLGRPIAGYPYASLKAIPGIWGLVAIAVCSLIGGLALTRRSTPVIGSIQPSKQHWLLVVLALATPIGLLVYSMVGTDLWLARGLYASVPAAGLVLGALLAAPARRVRTAVVAVVLATLLVGTVRALSPAYARPPFRTIAAYLDRVAGPHDPIIMYLSFVDPAIPAQFHKPHLVLRASASQWPAATPGGKAFVIFDDRTAQIFKIATPHPRGFQLVGRRHYKGLVWVTLLTYRALPGG